MRRLLSLLVLVTTLSYSQTVPREMNFGGMKLTINDAARRQIQKDVDRLTASQTYYGILVDRMNLYFPIIERAFKENGIPEEIKFLAIQESALISDAVSVANAVGFWQFKDFTAREVGLKVGRNVDERQNIVSASYGASRYLKKSNDFFFDNWIYAVMAYNTGPTGALKLTDKSKHGAKKMTIDNKTHWYVKKFLAHVVAFTPSVGLPHSENIWLDEDRNVKGMSLSQIARKHKVEPELVKKYNKWLLRGSVPSDKKYTVLIPKQGRAPRKQMIAEKTKEKPVRKISEPKSKIYPTEIKRGITRTDKATIIPLNGIPSILSKDYDDVHALSARAGISEKRFRKYNDMGPADGVIPGEFYYIKKKKGKSKIGYHVAKKGETLWDVSQHYGLQLSKLASKNRLSIIDEVKTGRVLWLKKSRPASTEIAYHKQEESIEGVVLVASNDRVEYDDSDEIIVTAADSSDELKKVSIHTVAPGESLWAITKKYDVLMEDLLRWNELENPDALGIGQNIRVKPPVEEVLETKPIANHRVLPGETLYAISRKYEMTVDELMELNRMSKTNLSVGDLLKVYDN